MLRHRWSSRKHNQPWWPMIVNFDGYCLHFQAAGLPTRMLAELLRMHGTLTCCFIAVAAV